MKTYKRAFVIFTIISLFGIHLIFARSNPDSFRKNGVAKTSETMVNDLRVNDDTGTDDQESPAIDMNKYGQTVVCWEDLRSGNSRIYFQLFGSKGFAAQNNIEVSPVSGTVLQRDPDVAMNDLGHFVVVWADDHSGDFDIYAQMYAANATPIGSSFKVNDDVTDNAQIYPAIDMDGEGNFVICWTDYRDGTADIFAQRYGSDGTPLESNFMVNNAASYSRYVPDISMKEDGSFIIAWEDGRNALVYYIYARRYNSNGVALGDDFQVNLDLIGEKNHQYPTIAIQDDGKFMICYIIQGLVYALYAHLYDSDGSSLIDYFQIPEGGTSFNHIRPSVSAHPNGGFSVVWSSDANGTWDIYVKNYNNAGAPLGASSHVSDISGDQTHPVLAIDDRGVGITVWEDTRNTDKDIYGFGLGPLAPLNPTAGSGFAGIVPLSWDHIYAYSAIDVYKIYRGTTSGGPYDPLVDVDLSLRGALGRQMRDYIDTDVTNGATYFYKISAVVSGVESQRSIEVSATPSDEGYGITSGWSGTSPTIDGQISAHEWSDATALNIANPNAPEAITLYVKNNADHLYLAIDDPNDDTVDPGNLLGIIFDEDNNNLWDFSGPSGEGLITINNASVFFTGYWGTYPNSLGADVPIPATGVTKAILAASGNVQYEASFMLTNSPINASQGETIGIAIMLDDPTNFHPYHYGYAAEWPAGALWDAAMPLGDLTLATGGTNVSDRNANGTPSDFFLSQNYPNPFNPKTTIRYQLPITSHVELSIYSVLGKKLTTLVSEKQSAGSYEVEWDAREFASGVFIYQLETDKGVLLTKKLVLLK